MAIWTKNDVKMQIETVEQLYNMVSYYRFKNREDDFKKTLTNDFIHEAHMLVIKAEDWLESYKKEYVETLSDYQMDLYRASEEGENCESLIFIIIGYIKGAVFNKTA